MLEGRHLIGPAMSLAFLNGDGCLDGSCTHAVRADVVLGKIHSAIAGLLS